MTRGTQKRALVVGSTGGIGKALVHELEDRGYEVVPLSRSVDGLDLTDEESIARTTDQLSGHFELICVATGALEIKGHPPEKMLKALDPGTLAEQFALNAIGPALLLKHLKRFLPRDRRAVFAALSARVGSIGDNRLGGWYSYRAAKAALNQLIHTASIELSRSHKDAVCIVLHPGTVATSLTRNYQSHPSVAPKVAALQLLAVMERLTPASSGKFLDSNGKEIKW